MNFLTIYGIADKNSLVEVQYSITEYENPMETKIKLMKGEINLLNRKIKVKEAERVINEQAKEEKQKKIILELENQIGILKKADNHETNRIQKYQSQIADLENQTIETPLNDSSDEIIAQISTQNEQILSELN
jgi:hypothetical protein